MIAGDVREAKFDVTLDDAIVRQLINCLSKLTAEVSAWDEGGNYTTRLIKQSEELQYSLGLALGYAEQKHRGAHR